MSLREGLVVDRYVVERPIGKGGTAEVWSVRHRTLGTRRALKVLFVKRPDLHARLIEEGRAQARLSSDHIVPVLDVLEFEGAPALVMPLIEGPSLARLLEAHRPSEAEVAAIVRALLDGVREAHAAGLVHRDLKPTNVLLDLTWGGVRPRIADFGLVRSEASGLTRTGALLGTPVYAAPEQLRNAARADARADFWSLGVIVHELLTGALPYQGDDLFALVDLMEADTFPEPEGDPRWAALVRDLLRSRPEQRLCDFEEIRHRVDAISPPSEPSPLGAGTPLATVAWKIRSPVAEGATRQPATGEATHPPIPRTDNLPRERDAFVGRSAEASTLRAHLERSPLVTVTGPGGVGKTRLVLHVARSSRDDLAGVAFCDLTEARSLDGIVYAVARGLDVAVGSDAVTQLGHAIAGRGRFLLVLDNLEQVAEHAAATVGVWIDRAPEALFLVTSREPLRLRGESVFPLDVLSMPVEGERIDGSDAVSLFVTRAQQSDPSFRLDEGNAADVERLVRQLDGLPLAIELAAARVRSSPPARLLERLSKRFELLAGTSRDVSNRQRSLRATLDWSWEQLTPALQDAMVQLSLFEGGWTLEAAEFVVRLDDGVVEDVLAELVDRSLVRIGGSVPGGRSRFGMLVSVQEYAAEKREGFVSAEGAEARHGAWFARFGAPEVVDAMYTHGGVARGLALGRELDNIVAACSRAVTREDGAVAVALLEAAWAVLQIRGPLAVVVSLAERVLALASLSPRERASARFVLGAALHRAGRVDEGRAHLTAALEVVREVGDRRREGVVLGNLGILDRDQGRTDEARAQWAAALALARESGHRRNEGSVLHTMGILLQEQGRLDEAREHFEAALAVAREVGNLRSEAVYRSNLGIVQHEQGRLNEARAHYDAALAVFREVGNRRFEGVVLGHLGTLHYEQGRLSQARAHYEKELAVARAMGDRHLEGFALGHLGTLFRFLGEHDTATQYLTEALALHREVRHRYGESNWLSGLALIEAEVGSRDKALALAHDAVAIAEPFPPKQLRSLETLARVHLARGEVSAAREAIVRARALGPRRVAQLAAVDALVAVAEGDRRAAEAAIAEATADPAQCMLGSKVAQLVATAQSGLDSLGR